MNYIYTIEDPTTRIELCLRPVDDDIVEADETYNLTIVLLPSTHNRVITGKKMNTTKITIHNDDGKQLHM